MAGTLTAIHSARSRNPFSLDNLLALAGGLRRCRNPVEVPRARIRLILQHELDLIALPLRASCAGGDAVLFEETSDCDKPELSAREHLEDRANDCRLFLIDNERGRRDP